MTITTEEVERLMKRCQVGVGGKNALDDAHSIMAECYGTLGALVQERDRLLMGQQPSPEYDSGLGTSPMMWELLSDILAEHEEKLPDSLNKAIYALRDKYAYVGMK